MFEDTITNNTSKKYQKAVDFFNFIENEKLLDNIDINSKIHEKVELTIGEQTIFINKHAEVRFFEIFLTIDNFKHLQTLKLTKKEFNKLYKKSRVWIYNKEENLKWITMKNNYSKKDIEFIHNNLWFKDFGFGGI